jgi:hypothetical protein
MFERERIQLWPMRFFLSKAALLRSENPPARIALNAKFHGICGSIIEVGAFTFPHRHEFTAYRGGRGRWRCQSKPCPVP